MLTAIGIPEHNDKQKRINLHQRIELLDGQYLTYKNTLMAIKFLVELPPLKRTRLIYS